MRITWTTPSSVQVETHGQSPTVSRSLSFRAEDPERDVWRSLGLVAAALVSHPPENVAPVEPVRPPPPPPPPPAPLKRLPIFWIEGGAIAGNGLEDGPWAFGGVLRGAYQIPVIPIFVGAAASYAVAGPGPQGLQATWTTFSASAGTVIAVSDFALRPRLELLLSHLIAKSPESPAGSSGSRRVGGSGAGLEVSWPAEDRFSLVLGAEGAFLSGGTSIYVGDTRVSAFPALSYRFFLGIQATVLP